jgi:hypothetical protein
MQCKCEFFKLSYAYIRMIVCREEDKLSKHVFSTTVKLNSLDGNFISVESVLCSAKFGVFLR